MLVITTAVVFFVLFCVTLVMLLVVCYDNNLLRRNFDNLARVSKQHSDLSTQIINEREETIRQYESDFRKIVELRQMASQILEESLPQMKGTGFKN